MKQERKWEIEWKPWENVGSGNNWAIIIFPEGVKKKKANTWKNIGYIFSKFDENQTPQFKNCSDFQSSQPEPS